MFKPSTILRSVLDKVRLAYIRVWFRVLSIKTPFLSEVNVEHSILGKKKFSAENKDGYCNSIIKGKLDILF